VLWGEAGAYAHDAYARLLPLYPGLPDSLPIVIGITAYGHCLGLTRDGWQHGPRISLFSSQFERRRQVDDVMAHEMIHAWLMLRGEDPAHDGAPWYAAVRRLSPAILGADLDARRGADRTSARLPNPAYEADNGQPRTIVRKQRVPGAVRHGDVARWPQAFRPESYDWGEPIDCPSY